MRVLIERGCGGESGGGGEIQGGGAGRVAYSRVGGPQSALIWRGGKGGGGRDQYQRRGFQPRRRTLAQIALAGRLVRLVSWCGWRRAAGAASRLWPHWGPVDRSSHPRQGHQSVVSLRPRPSRAAAGHKSMPWPREAPQGATAWPSN